jgi:hypothetical protein
VSKNVLAIGILACALAACGGGGGGGGSAAAGSSGVLPAISVASTATATPAPGATSASGGSSSSSSASLPIAPDTSTSTAGVFLGIDCGYEAVVSCPNFSSQYRHGLAMGTMYSTWDQDLGRVIARAGMASWEASNMIPEVTWAPESAITPITLADIADGSWDTYITTSAEEVKAFAEPIFLRPFHEFNGGDTYPWNITENGDDAEADAKFIAAWRHVVTIFREVGATNAKFVWCFNNSSTPNDQWNQPASAYPGDDYVDWIAWDAYNDGSETNGKEWLTFDWLMKGPYATATAISATKPIMIAETASNEYGDGGAMKAQWIQAMAAELSGSTNPFPRLKAISWFESDKNGYFWPTNSSTDSFNTFVSQIRLAEPTGTMLFRSNGKALWNITST